MNLPEWFTEENFEKWLEGRLDYRRDQAVLSSRMRTCPLALFARENGLTEASVGGDWLHAGLGTPVVLPQWARDVMKKFDTLYYGEEPR